MLVRLTDDRGSMMERLRKRMSADVTQDVEDLSALHYATTLFERNVRLLRQLALWLREDTRVSAPSRTSKISKVFRGGGPLTPCHNSVPHSSRLCLMR